LSALDASLPELPVGGGDDEDSDEESNRGGGGGGGGGMRAVTELSPEFRVELYRLFFEVCCCSQNP
jgi:hypothetical protein